MLVLPDTGPGGLADQRIQQVAKVAHQPHVLALVPQVRRVHLDELPDEDAGARIGLVLEPLHVGHRGANEIVHELELAANRGGEPGELSAIRAFRCCGELGHPVRVSGPWGRTPEPGVSVRAGV